MKFNTSEQEKGHQLLAEWQQPSGWQKVQGEIPDDLEAMARANKALVRGRKIKTAESLLRLVLVYAVCDWSLRMVGAWAVIQQVAAVSDVALLYRFCQCQKWLGHLLVRILQQRNVELRELAGVRLRLIDTTGISQPGSSGTNWRIHVSMDLGKMCLDGVEITDEHSKESLARFPSRADEIWVGDRGFAFAKPMGLLLHSAVRLVVRIGWVTFPLTTDGKHRLNLIDWIKPLTQVTERTVVLSTPLGDFPLRLIASPLPPDQAEHMRERLRKQARKKGKRVHPHTLIAAGFVLLVTNLPSELWPVERVLYLYRLRWQIELQFKRMKSLLCFDHLRAQDPRLVQTYLLAKLLAAVLLDRLVQQVEEQHPDLFGSLQRPVSLWRLHALLWSGIRAWIIGPISLDHIFLALPWLGRYLRDAPRSRLQQLAWARRFLVRLSYV